jgi:hypothetical protein
MPRLPTIVDNHSVIAQAGLLTSQLTGIREDDLGWILIVRPPLLLRTDETLYRNLGLYQAGPTWEPHFEEWTWNSGLTCAGYGSCLAAKGRVIVCP